MQIVRLGQVGFWKKVSATNGALINSSKLHSYRVARCFSVVVAEYKGLE